MNSTDSEHDLELTRLLSDAFLVLAVVGFGVVYLLGLSAGNLPEIALLKGAAALVLVAVAGRLIDSVLAQRQQGPATVAAATRGSRLDVRLDDSSAPAAGAEGA